jgi:hypothetical protein
MLFTLIAMHSRSKNGVASLAYGAWLAWREYQQRKSSRRRLLLAGTSIAGAPPGGDPLPPFWTTLLARYRREMTMSQGRRARTRKAIERINMASERKSRAGGRRS